MTRRRPQSPAPRPLKVWPVIEERRIDGATVFLAAVERWSDAFYIRYCVWFDHDIMESHPPLRVRVRDNAGRNYTSGGSGGFSGADWVLSTQRTTQPPSDEASELEIEIAVEETSAATFRIPLV